MEIDKKDLLAFIEDVEICESAASKESTGMERAHKKQGVIKDV